MAFKTPWAVLVIALFLCSCGPRAADIDQDPRVLARVDGHEITVSWFEQTYVDYLIQTGANDTRRNRAVHLDNLIDAALLSDQAEEMGITESKPYQLFLERERRSILGARYFETEFLRTLPPPTDTEIRETFVRWKEQPVVRHLFYTNLEEAEAAYERLLSGRDFLEEAQDCYGLVQFDSTAGYLGPIRYFGVDDAFAEAAFDLEQGSFSAPVRSRFGYHIIRVENRIREALLTESDYQTRRPGLESQFRLRKRRLEGDRFVRAFMEKSNVEVNADAIEALRSLLNEFAVKVNPSPTVNLSSEGRFKSDSLRAVMNATTVLATYEWKGKRSNFTTGDYLLWLEKLPFQEALNRTAASVGRAMRNELLATAGKDEGLADQITRAKLEREGLQERARLVRGALRERTDVAIDDELVQRGYAQLGLERRRLYRADFDVVEFQTIGEADRVRQEAERDPESLTRQPNLVSYMDVSLSELPEWLSHVSTAPENQPVVVGTARGWSVLLVKRRVQIEMNWEEHRDEMMNAIRPYAAEFQMIKTLRSETPIDVDSLLFEQIMILDGMRPTGPG